jgi:NAD(P)-dependent dehydrogenase (short-subunit alcohol dehydrogenase family)
MMCLRNNRTILQKQYAIQAIAVKCDVSVEDECALLIKQAVATFGQIDVLINNAGISMRALFNDVNWMLTLKNADGRITFGVRYTAPNTPCPNY